MRRHDRAAIRAAATKYKRRRLRLWTERWGVPEETAVRAGRSRVEEFFRLAQRMKHLAQDVYRVPFLIASQVTFNQGSRVWQAAESQQIERAATLVVRLDRDKQRREQYTLHCEKTRLGLEFGSVGVHMDKAHSRVHLLDDHRPPEERVA